MPKKTSPCGLPLVRMALLTATPASPSSRTFSLYPDSASNSSRTFSEAAKELWLTRVTVLEPLPCESPLELSAHAESVTIPSPAATAAAVTFLVVLTWFFLLGADQEETRPRPRTRTGCADRRNSLSGDRTSYPE